MYLPNQGHTRMVWLICLLGLTFLMVSCSSDEAPPVDDAASATINSVEVQVLESLPVQVNALVKGTVPDSCVTVGTITQVREEQTFKLTVPTLRATEGECVTEAQPFEQTVSLDVLGAGAGAYAVEATSANRISNSFELAADNTAPEPEPEAEPSPVVTGGAEISGAVWKDYCAILDAASNTPSEGCVGDGGAGFRGDGIKGENEELLAGIEVRLNPGGCDTGDLAVYTTTLTGEDGRYVFTLEQVAAEGTLYCVSIDPLSETNSARLIPGEWTFPSTLGSTEVTVAPTESKTADFGWDFQFDAPETPEVSDDPTCENIAAYVEDVTIPDDQLLAAGEAFVKTWRVRNDGSCTWDPSYSFIFTGGNQMGGPASVALEQLVPPSTTVDISVPMTAPPESGTHRGEWKLQTPAGVIFGSRGDYPLYVQIVVP